MTKICAKVPLRPGDFLSPQNRLTYPQSNSQLLERPMPETGSKTAKQPAMRRLQVAGAVLFIVSFFLPAYHYDLPSAPLRGYECAMWAFSGGIDGLSHWSPKGLLLIMSDLINLLVPLYLVLSFISGKEKLRTRTIFLTFACMIATWLWFALDKKFPLIGHFAWIAGALLVLLPQWMADRKLVAETSR
jgi:hypothetical protein